MCYHIANIYFPSKNYVTGVSNLRFRGNLYLLMIDINIQIHILKQSNSCINTLNDYNKKNKYS